MQVDIRVPVGLPIPQVADLIARCEDAGFDGVGVQAFARVIRPRLARTSPP